MAIENDPIRTLAITLIETSHNVIMSEVDDTIMNDSIINQAKQDIIDFLHNENIHFTSYQVKVLRDILDAENPHEIAILMDDAVSSF